ncbi:kynureninase [uncultured Sphingomonas sp.]|uniref:kynureninase n=1 Tax=uncultured Sphingomonas sp. TaxID=158754 RepID=UPI0025D81A94|nr:kynureninase [uncultured Sphingomonas sp.]
MATLDAARARDAADPLAPMRARFALPAGKIYLDGNSLGVLPQRTMARMERVVTREWGQDLIGSWNAHDWIGAPLRIGDRIAPLIGAAAGEVAVADSTSANLFKLLAAAIAARPGRRTILSEPGNFPTDLYVASGVADFMGATLKTVPADRIVEAIDDDVAVVLLTHVHYKTARRLDMATITAAAHAAGALTLWDLSHSVGAVPVDLNDAGADLAVGCGYKYLNGGPGAPAFLFVAGRHHARLRSPLSGWMGHSTPFAFDDGYDPAPGIARFLCGTPPILGLAALEEGLALFEEVDFTAVTAKSVALSTLLIERVEERCAAFGLELATPRDPAARGSHVSFRHPHAYALCQALIEDGVVGDFRAPDILRFGLTPLYLGYADVWQAVEKLHDILEQRRWDDPRFRVAMRVT